MPRVGPGRSSTSPTVDLDEPPRDRETEARAVARAGAPEAVEGARPLLLGQARALVDDVQLDPAVSSPELTLILLPGGDASTAFASRLSSTCSIRPAPAARARPVAPTVSMRRSRSAASASQRLGSSPRRRR